MTGTSGRLLQLLSLLQARRDWPGHLLAERLEVSERTVRRDVDRLRDLGYPVRATMGPDGGYRLDAGADLPPLLFDDEQAVALAVALQLAASTGAGIADAAWRALGTVRQVMPGRLRHRVDALHIVPTPEPAAPQIDPAVLLAVSDAARGHQQLRFDYRAAVTGPDGAEEAPRRVEPHHVVNRAGRWYLLAWDLDRDDWRTFRVDRMRPRSPTGPRFLPRDVPGGEAAAFVAARFRGHTEPKPDHGWPCQGTVVLHRPASDIAPYVTEGAVEDLGPDRCRLEMGAWSWAGLAASIARTDADIEDVRPPELVQAFADLARRALAAAGGRGTIGTVASKRFSATVADGGRGRILVPVTFDPDALWGNKTRHPVAGTIRGHRFRGTIEAHDDVQGFLLGPAWLRGCPLDPGDVIEVEVAPEGPQRDDLADDIAAALAASPQAAAFFDSLAQFYRRGYLRWVDATTRSPEKRAQRIATMVELLEAGVKDYRQQ